MCCPYCSKKVRSNSKEYKNEKINSACWKKYVYDPVLPYPFRYDTLTGIQIQTYYDDYNEWKFKYIKLIADDLPTC